MEARLLCLVLLGMGCQSFRQSVCEWKTCRDCIRDPNLCMWCASENFQGNSRCIPMNLTDKNWCASEDIQNPPTHKAIGESKDFSSEVGHMVQIKPHSYNLDLRVGQEQTFSFSYKASDNFPVDLYFLLDTSRSMRHVKDDLLDQTIKIYKAMSNLTTDVYMGLGTFIDKNMIPFNNNLTGNNPYSFKHQLSLTNETGNFKDALNKLEFWSNSDDPESGLEGIAQAVACKDIINWRKQSRKILVLMTDQAYHAAGDGKAAGIIRPYDGGCYLNKTGFYTKEKEMDYPSVGIINYMVTRAEIKILFVSDYREQTVYSTLTSAITESELLKWEPKAIADELKETYRKISQQLKLKVNLTDIEKEHFDVTFEPNCDIDNCKVTAGQEMNFTGKILLRKYFNKDRLHIGINPIGLTEEIVLNVAVVSDCGCSKSAVLKSPKCHNIGNWTCGVCECPDAKFGPDCGCTGNSSHCSPPNSDQVCSDRGSCNPCGVCECDTGYTGTYCESQNNNCPRDSGNTLCSGRGSCLNGICSCIGDWTGSACECTTSHAPCIRDGVECNRRGHCECGTCKCDPPAKWDARFYDSYNFCKQRPCFDCHNQQCRHLAPCIHCLYKGGSCKDICGDTLIVLSQSEYSEVEDTKWENCSNIKVDFGCNSNFKYVYNDNNTMTIVVFDTTCAMSRIYIGLISVIVLLIIGLATLLAWKLLTDARDRREYEAFLKSARGDDSIRINPTYTAPSTTYFNPAFQSSLQRKF